MLEEICETSKEFILKAMHFCNLCDENYKFSQIDTESIIVLGALATFGIAAGIWIWYGRTHNYDFSSGSNGHRYNPRCNCIGCSSYSRHD